MEGGLRTIQTPVKSRDGEGPGLGAAADGVWAHTSPASASMGANFEIILQNMKEASAHAR